MARPPVPTPIETVSAMGTTDLLLYGDTERHAALRHELPIAIMDPFLLGVIAGRVHVMASTLERDRIAAAAPDAVIHDVRDFGYQELMESDMSRDEMWLELTSRVAAAMGIREAIADPDMPLIVADRLRADGIELTPDRAAVEARRRVKTEAELAGIRRAQRAAEAGMRAAAEMLRQAEPDGEQLRLDGEPLTAEAIRAALRKACAAQGAPAPPDVMVTSGWDGFGHDPGSGPRPAGLPITIDLWPRDEESGCWADMTRTFVVGDVSDEVRELERVVTEGFAAARDAVRPGITGRELHGITCDVLEAAGYRTQRTGPAEDDPNGGFQFGLGHGVGLEVHEAPSLGRLGREELVAGDVIAIEPGLWKRGLGEVRFEDLLLVTESASETLTGYPYDLAP
jgi:Xaa-Pro aminopeptidase